MVGIVQELLPLRRDVQLFGKPFKELHMVVLFQLGDGLTDGRLRNIELSGSRVHGSVFGNGGKNAKMAYGHRLPLFDNKK